jgi:hypothetical protein
MVYSVKVPSLLPHTHRQKEAGNINTSLHVLGRCIKAIRCVILQHTILYRYWYRTVGYRYLLHSHRSLR